MASRRAPRTQSGGAGQVYCYWLSRGPRDMARPGAYCFGGTVAGSRVAAVTRVRRSAGEEPRSETSVTRRVRGGCAAAASCTVGRPVGFLL